ncbi:TRA1-like protein [Mya arenaria]|uniref:TRA1-like protein n=1 Tax=Mya arenaria TaxID=6604 RepID=A0ABY7DSY4_MYAAR|nr:TRA1-like protein [Mya arenaria]
MHHMRFATEEDKAEAIEFLHKELMKCFSVATRTNKTFRGKQQSADPPLPNMNFDEDPETNDVICADEPTQPKKIKLEAPKQDVSKTEPISWLDDIIFVKETKALDLTKLAKKEMDCYLSEPSVDPRYPALSWWKQNESKYPKLSILAKKYLAIPASSVSSERIFSLTGNLISKKRSRLRSYLVDMMVFLNKNKK